MEQIAAWLCRELVLIQDVFDSDHSRYNGRKPGKAPGAATEYAQKRLRHHSSPPRPPDRRSIGPVGSQRRPGPPSWACAPCPLAVSCPGPAASAARWSPGPFPVAWGGGGGVVASVLARGEAAQAVLSSRMSVCPSVLPGSQLLPLPVEEYGVSPLGFSLVLLLIIARHPVHRNMGYNERERERNKYIQQTTNIKIEK